MKTQARQKEIKKLLFWYDKNKRKLPWRKDADPYKIWVSEVMLQQTTAQYVVPYFNRLIQKYPNLESLAKASEKGIFEIWSGLGYYSRARNLLKTAQQILKNKKFPMSSKEWECFPGVGSYTARAISSQAFGEKVGVLDGNTIRLFSRKEGLKIKWWNVEGKRHLQKLADEFTSFGNNSGTVNQALMELGATICRPKNPSCFLCPWKGPCKAYQKNLVSEFPLARQRPIKEIWKWEPHIYQIRGRKNQLKIAFVKNNYAPFLKNYFIFPGKVKKLIQKPKHFNFSHTITHRKIYTQIKYLFLGDVDFKALKSLPIHDLHGLDLKEGLLPLSDSNQKHKDKSSGVKRDQDRVRGSTKKGKNKGFENQGEDLLKTLFQFEEVKWILKEAIKKENPSSLIQKTLQFF